MPANTAPIYSLTPVLGAVAVTAANTSSQGGGTIGTDIFLAFTAGSDGAWISRIRFMPTATAAGTSTTATVGRVFLSTQASGATTSANTHLVAEVTLSTQTADSASANVLPVDVPLNIAVPAGTTVLVTNHSAPAANTSWKVTVHGGNY